MPARTVIDRSAWRVRGELGPALRRGAVVGIPTAIVIAVGLPRDAKLTATLSMATLLAGFIAFDAPARIRMIWLAALAPVAGIAGAIGVLTSEPALLAVVVMALLGTAVGYCVAISPRAYVAALMCLLGLLVAQGLFLGTDEAPRILALGIAGTLVQAACALAVWVGSDRTHGRFDLADGIRGAREAFASKFSLDSIELRHALRFGTALGVGVAAYNLLDLRDHGYWIPLTVLFVLRPDPEDTVERLAMRAAGTLAGLGIGTTLAELAGSEAVVVGVIVGGAAAVAYAMLALEYAVFTTAITVVVVVISHALGEPAFETADQRALDTVIGIAIAALSLFAPFALSAAWRGRRSRAAP